MDTQIATVEEQFMPVAATMPEDVVAYARKCAQAIKPVIDADPKKLEINGKRYLYFESWQTIGWFYGVTAQVVDTYELDSDGRFRGYGAKANAIRGGQTIATAYSECSIDEARWRGRDRFAVLSMAQTRAMAKALRSCLAWVAVLGGYGPATAEEMEDMERPAPKGKPAQRRPEPSAPKPHNREAGSITVDQKQAINNAIKDEKGKAAVQGIVKAQGFDIKNSGDLSDYQAAIILHVLDGGDAKDIA